MVFVVVIPSCKIYFAHAFLCQLFHMRINYVDSPSKGGVFASHATPNYFLELAKDLTNFW